MFKRKNNKKKYTRTTYYFEVGGNVIFKVEDNQPTMFPEKLARANEILKKATLLPPLTKK